jgi:hypothetical protein
MNESKEEKIVMIKVVLPDILRHNFKAACATNRSNMNTILLDYIKRYVEETKKSSSKNL